MASFADVEILLNKVYALPSMGFSELSLNVKSALKTLNSNHDDYYQFVFSLPTDEGVNALYQEFLDGGDGSEHIDELLEDIKERNLEADKMVSTALAFAQLVNDLANEYKATVNKEMDEIDSLAEKIYRDHYAEKSGSRKSVKRIASRSVSKKPMRKRGFAVHHDMFEFEESDFPATLDGWIYEVNEVEEYIIVMPPDEYEHTVYAVIDKKDNWNWRVRFSFREYVRSDRSFSTPEEALEDLLRAARNGEITFIV